MRLLEGSLSQTEAALDLFSWFKSLGGAVSETDYAATPSTLSMKRTYLNHIAFRQPFYLPFRIMFIALVRTTDRTTSVF